MKTLNGTYFFLGAFFVQSPTTSTTLLGVYKSVKMHRGDKLYGTHPSSGCSSLSSKVCSNNNGKRLDTKSNILASIRETTAGSRSASSPTLVVRRRTRALQPSWRCPSTFSFRGRTSLLVIVPKDYFHQRQPSRFFSTIL